MTRPIDNKYFALAGVCQAAQLVQQIARNSQVDSSAMEASLNSLLMVDADSTEEVFGGIKNLTIGFRVLATQLGNKSANKDAELTRYIAGILQLERKLTSKSSKMNELGERITQLQRQQSLFDINDAQMLSNIASVYTDIISKLGPRIQVAGNPALLKQPAVQDKVRALLLSGIRAAVLWRQLGGKRRQILLNRQKILSGAEMALQRIEHIF
ncbi:high frequency lysogenization protein HflD [Alteromonadaceae bacterium BrNp21-10]|nr:high frequency lysogenization protein HflD [Alteromonadaceae bacterium BrNp21-10]